jgi:hypothetical protein
MLFSREKREEREQNTKIIKESNAFRVLCVFRGHKKICVYLRSSVDLKPLCNNAFSLVQTVL